MSRLYRDVQVTADCHVVVPGLRMHGAVPVSPPICFMACQGTTLLSPIIYFLVVRFEVLVSVKTALYFAVGHHDSCQCCGGRCRTMFFPQKANSLML